MSKEAVLQVLERAIGDQAFASQLKANFEAAIKGYDLTAEGGNRMRFERPPGWVDGERASIGYLRMAPGTFSKPHWHDEEQFIYVTKGRARVAVEGEAGEVGPGALVHFPPRAVHEVMALEEPVEFLLSLHPARSGGQVSAFGAEGEKARSALRG